MKRSSMSAVLVLLLFMTSSVRGYDWDTESSVLLLEIADKLDAAVKKYHPEAKVEVKDFEIVCKFHSRNFKIHTILKDGSVMEKASDRVGPGNDGIILTAWLSKDPYAGPPQGAFGIRRMIYWTQYCNEYKIQNGRSYLKMTFSFAVNTKREILRDFCRVASEYGQPILAEIPFAKEADSTDVGKPRELDARAK